MNWRTCWVSSLVSWTVAPTITDPPGSTRRPVIWPDIICEYAAGRIANSRNKTAAHALVNFMGICLLDGFDPVLVCVASHRIAALKAVAKIWWREKERRRAQRCAVVGLEPLWCDV